LPWPLAIDWPSRLQLVQPGSLITIPSLGVTSQYHALTHSDWTGPRCRSVVKLFMSELSVFIQSLKGMGEAGGSALLGP
jgi:hypothetical protein